MKRRVNLMLWVRKSRGQDANNPDQKVSIYLRISVEGRRQQLNVHTGFKTVRRKWQAAGQLGRVLGKSEADQRINAGLNELQTTLRSTHADLERKGLPITARSLWDAYLKTEESICDVPLRRTPIALPTFTWPRL
jgi:hypothetical protein